MGAAPVRLSSCAPVPLFDPTSSCGRRSLDSPPTQLAFKSISLRAHGPPHLQDQDTCTRVFLEPWVSWAATLLLKAQSLILGILNTTQPTTKRKQHPPPPCLAHFPLCLIMTTLRILFLGELHLPPDKPFLSNILGDLLGK